MTPPVHDKCGLVKHVKMPVVTTGDGKSAKYAKTCFAFRLAQRKIYCVKIKYAFWLINVHFGVICLFFILSHCLLYKIIKNDQA